MSNYTFFCRFERWGFTQHITALLYFCVFRDSITRIKSSSKIVLFWHKMQHYVVTALVFLSLAGSSVAWDTEEMEIFDLVEEINENFYTALGVQQVGAIIQPAAQTRKKSDPKPIGQCTKKNVTRKRYLIVSHSYRMQLWPKSNEPSGRFQLYCIRISLMHRTQTLNFEILCQCTKRSKIRLNEKSKQQVTIKKRFDFILLLLLVCAQIQYGPEEWTARLAIGTLLLSACSQNGSGRNGCHSLCYPDHWPISNCVGRLR